MKKVTDIVEKLERPFNEGGYKFEDKHFSTGRKIHSENFYYFRNFLQDYENTNSLLEIVPFDLFAQFKRKSVTLISNKIYAELLLTLLEKKIKVEITNTVNFGIIDSASDELTYYYEPEVIYENVILVLPVTCTLEGVNKIKEKIEGSSAGSKSICKMVISVFAILHSALKKQIEELKNGESICVEKITNLPLGGSCQLEDIQELYIEHSWSKISKDEICLKNSECKVITLIQLFTELYLSHKCKLCFPDNPTDEIPLFETRGNHDTPNLIYRTPSFINTLGQISNRTFEDVFHLNKQTGVFDESYLFGHLKIDNSSNLSYIRREKFYANNKDGIISHFVFALRNIFGDNFYEVRNFIIVTQLHHKGSQLFKDLFSEWGNAIGNHNIEYNFIYISPYEEFLENFITDFKRVTSKNSPYSLLARQKGNHKIIYFDFVISAGKNFKVISDYLRYSQEEVRKGFDALLTVIDRTTEFSKREILRKLNPRNLLDRLPSFMGSDDFKAKHQAQYSEFIAFFKLNVPLLDVFNTGNLIDKKISTLKNILGETHLDALKERIYNNIQKEKPKTLVELKGLYNEKYGEDFEGRFINLLKLYIPHKIENYISQQIKGKTESEKLKWVLDVKQLIAYFETDIVYPFLKYHPNIVGHLVIKALSYPFYTYYRSIHAAIFSFIVKSLDKQIESINNGESEINVTTINELEFYIKSSVRVNSNYILSNKFWGFLKKNLQINNVNCTLNKYYLLKCYKELNFRTSYRTIRLEEIINKEQHLPQVIAHRYTNTIESALRDEFYQLGRIIKTENIEILSRYKNVFKDFLRKEYLNSDGNKISFENAYESFLKGNPEIASIYQQFSKKSKHYQNKAEFEIILNATREMLSAIFLLEEATQGFKSKESNSKYSLVNQLEELLKTTTKVLNISNTDYALCVDYYPNYNDGGSESAAKVVVFSNKANAILNRVSKKGLIWNFLKGVYTDSENPNKTKHYSKTLITLLPIAKISDGRYVSFNKNYFRKDQFGNTPIQLSLIEHDIITEESGIIPKSANTILLIRLAETVDTSKREFNLQGRAVLVLYAKTDGSAVSFFDLINVEKVRLLLLIKKELLDYLNNLIEYGYFGDIIGNYINRFWNNTLDHSVNKFYGTAIELLDCLHRGMPKYSGNPLLQDLVSVKAIFNTLFFQLYTRNDLSLPDSTYYTKVFKKDNFEELFYAIMLTDSLYSKRKFGKSEVTISFNEDTFSIIMPVLIFYVIVAELYLNFRKYALVKNNIVALEINKYGKSFVFTNASVNENDKVVINEYPKRQYTGLFMSNSILKKLGMNHLVPYFTTIGDSFFFNVALEL